MSMINYASREINCKLVYYGPGLGGKTTNLEHIYGKVSPNTRGKMISLATETERTLFFDFLPVDLGTIRGFKTRFHARVCEPGRQDRQPMDRPRPVPRGGGGPRRRRVRYLEDGEQGGLEDAELGGGLMRWTLPNILTLARICLTPVLALLPFIQGYWPKVIAFLIFLAASASDVVDGYVARRRNQVSELGQLHDPIADKLLPVATLIPIFWLTRHPTILVDYRIPWWGSFPVWVALLLVGRELLMTAFRFFAKRRGVVIPAMGAGKLKAVVQNVFIGATLFWFAWKDALATHPWAGWFRNFWDQFHGAVVALTLAGAILLTIYSLIVYLYRYRQLLK